MMNYKPTTFTVGKRERPIRTVKMQIEEKPQRKEYNTLSKNGRYKFITMIKNRVRNTLGPIQTLHDVVAQLIAHDADDENSVNIWNWVVKSNLTEHVQQSIDKLILLAKAAV